MAAALQNAQFWEASVPAGLQPTPAQNGGSRAPTVASDCDPASPEFPNVCFLPNLAQADEHRVKASERYCAR
jgi:hypothetical protein